MKKIITFLFITIYSLSSSQVKALTEDGKEVVLFDNKTWRFVNETDEKTLDGIETNETAFVKSKESTFLLKSKKIEAGIYINPKKWRTSKTSNLPTAEYTFQNSENPNVMMMGCLISEIVPIQTLKNLLELKISTLQGSVDYFKINKTEYRTVNGMKVLFLDYSVNTKGIDFRYIGNYYLTEEGYASSFAFSYENSFDKGKAEMQNFINGLVKAEKSKTAEIIEYTSPPPPMSTKK